jgi:hypothetical protein
MEIIEDNQLFKRIGLTKLSSFMVSIDKQTFVDCFNEHVSDEVDFFERSAHNKTFHGRITATSFKLIRPTKWINNSSIAVTKGTYENMDSRLKVELVTYIPMRTILLLLSMWLLIVIISSSMMMFVESTPTIISVVFGLFYLHFILRAYLHFRKAVSTMSDEIEREIGYWTAKANEMHHKL